MGFSYLFIFPPCYVALCGSKARHRLGSESASWCLEASLFFKTPFLGLSSTPTSFVSLFIFYIFSYLLSKKMGCFSGCLMSFAGILKLFCGIFSASKCSFDEFIGGESGLPVLFLHHLRTAHQFEHSLALPFFGVGMETDLFQSCGHC